MKKQAGRATIPQRMEKQSIPMRKLVAIVFLGLILLACLLSCGYFGVKTIHRSRQRRAAMAAFERKDYLTAERLLRRYVDKDQNCEPEIAALATIYRSFGNTGYEAQLWQRACALNPLNSEYQKNLLESAIRSANYDLLYITLGRDVKTGVALDARELYLYVIAAFRSGHSKEGGDAYRHAVQDDPEAFHKSDLGYIAELMARSEELTEWEQEEILERAKRSEDPVVRFEAIFSEIAGLSPDDEDVEANERTEELLKQLSETNYYAGTPFLVDFYYSKFRFPEVVAVAEPYQKTIDDLDTYLLYAESCVFTGELDKLRALEQKLRKKSGSLQLMGDYCAILTAYMEGDEAKLAANIRQSGKLVSSPLSRFIRLSVALSGDSFSEILSAAKALFASPPFHDLHNRALLGCLDYLDERIGSTDDPDYLAQLGELARILAAYVPDNQLLTDVVLFDQYRRGLVKESDLLEAQERFPDDLLLLQITAEYLVLDGKAEKALELIEPAVANYVENRKVDFLHMLALDQLQRYDEAAVIFRRLVEQSEFDTELLYRYFEFCNRHERADELNAMADKLESAGDDALKPLSGFFRAAALLLKGDEASKAEALKMLSATPNDNPEFTFYAANTLNTEDVLDEAETKYRAILKTYPKPGLIYVNLSEVYQAGGEQEKALEAAKEAYLVEKKSILPAFIYARRLSEAGRFEEAVDVLKFPRHAVNYRSDVVELWSDCMRKVIENSIRDRKYLQAEEQCKHLLLIVPNDEFGLEKLAEVREILFPKKEQEASRSSDAAAS